MDINGQWKDCATLQRKLKRSPSSSSSAWPWRPSLQPFVEQAAGVGLSQEADCLLPAGALVVDQLAADQVAAVQVAAVQVVVVAALVLGALVLWGVLDRSQGLGLPGTGRRRSTTLRAALGSWS